MLDAEPHPHVRCAQCHHDFMADAVIAQLTICPHCYQTLHIGLREPSDVTLANGRHVDGLDTEELAALRRQRSALRKAARV